MGGRREGGSADMDNSFAAIGSSHRSLAALPMPKRTLGPMAGRPVGNSDTSWARPRAVEPRARYGPPASGEVTMTQHAVGDG